MDDYWYEVGGSDDSGYEDQTSWNNGGDWSVGNEYNGYTPGMDDYSNLDTNYNQDNGGSYYDYWNNPQDTSGGEFASIFGGLNIPGMNTDTGETWNVPNVGGIENTLAGIFSGGMDNPLIGKGLSALMEGYQNNKKKSAMKKITAMADPWASQRPFYQQQAKQAVTDPYSSPIVQAQITQLQNAQNIKDAAAGRRSNTLTSSPAVMAQMAQIAQQYQNQMAQQGGYGINPSAAGISAATSGANADINGYISPLLTALGWNNQNNSNDSVLANLTQDQKKALAKQWATQ